MIEDIINEPLPDTEIRETIIRICMIMGQPNPDLNLLEKYFLKIGISLKNRDGTFRPLDDLLMDLSHVANS